MKFTTEQKQFILVRADAVIRKTVLLATLFVVVYLLCYDLLPGDWHYLAFPVYWLGFWWLGRTQLVRIKHAFGFETEKKKESKWKQLVKWLDELKGSKKGL